MQCLFFDHLLFSNFVVDNEKVAKCDFLTGRDSKTALELTIGIILSLENYEKANAGLRELFAWKFIAPTFAIAL